MKRLHKKIGVGVLVAGLLLGVGGISGGSVAHADFSERNEMNEELLSKFNNEPHKKNDLKSIMNVGYNKYQVVNVNGKDEKLKLAKGYSRLVVEDRDFMKAVRNNNLEQIGLKGGGIYELSVYGLDVLIAVFPR